MLVHANTGYNAGEKLRACAPGLYARIRDHVPGLPDDQAAVEKYWSFDGILDMEELGVLLSQAGLELTIKKFPRSLRARYAPDRPDAAPVHIHLSGLSLLTIGGVEELYAPDARQLQSMLDQGWRIIAVRTNEEGTVDHMMGRSRESVL